VDRRLHQRWTLNHFVIAVWSANKQNPRREVLGGHTGNLSGAVRVDDTG
jgi:hypothetical protein